MRKDIILSGEECLSLVRRHHALKRYLYKTTFAEIEKRDIVEKLWSSVRPLIMSIISKMRRGSPNYDEYVAEAYLVTVKAVDLFDPDRDIRWTTYITKCVWARVLHVDRKMNMIHVPYNERKTEYGKHMMNCVESLSLSDEIQANHVDDSLRELRCEVVQAALRHLSGDGLLVIKARLSGETLQEIGDRMDISKERVRQIETTAIKKLILYCRSISSKNKLDLFPSLKEGVNHVSAQS